MLMPRTKENIRKSGLVRKPRVTTLIKSYNNFFQIRLVLKILFGHYLVTVAVDKT